MQGLRVLAEFPELWCQPGFEGPELGADWEERRDSQTQEAA